MQVPPSNYKAARMLGLTSLAVGATEIFATRWLERTIGVTSRPRGLIRSFGVREMANGAAILNEPGVTTRLAASLWARVAGDVLDLAALGKAVTTTRNARGLSAIIATVVVVTGLDVLVAASVQRELAEAKRVSAAARQRVTPTAATPKGAMGVNPGAAGREPSPSLSI